MVEDKVEPHTYDGRQRPLWTELFQGFRVALDPNKLVLAAAGILVMAFWWWLMAVIFHYDEPEWNAKDYPTSAFAEAGSDEARKEKAWKKFKQDRSRWDLNHLAAGSVDQRIPYDAADYADTLGEYEALKEVEKAATLKEVEKSNPVAKVLLAYKDKYPDLDKKFAKLQEGRIKPSGALRTWPWFESRGPNPYILVSGQTRGWESGHFWDWLWRTEVPVLLEPLFKLVYPVVLFFSPDAGPLNALYFLLVLFWTVVTWGLFGGAITRIAAVQVARQEKITLPEAVRFTARRWVSFVTAPLFPLLLAGFLLLFMIVFGFFHMIPWFGDVIVDGVFWWLMLLFGLLMAVGLVGLIGWPLMSATVSTEGTDSWEAVSRSYSYVFQAPWQYLWYGVLALAYGAIVVFFVGFMGSFAVYLSKWGVSQTPWVRVSNRDPAYLFVYAPTSFGWRDLLLRDVVLDDGTPVVDRETGHIIPQNYEKYLGRDDKYNERKSNDTLTTMNAAGARMVAFWLGLFFLLILGFGYSYFWSASAIIYLLMRKKVDDNEMDEVYLEEEGDSYAGPLTAPAPAPAPAGAAPVRPGQPLTMVESPTLRPPAAGTTPTAPLPQVPPVVVRHPEPPAPTPAPEPEVPAPRPLEPVVEPKPEPAATAPDTPEPPAPKELLPKPPEEPI